MINLSTLDWCAIYNASVKCPSLVCYTWCSVTFLSRIWMFIWNVLMEIELQLSCDGWGSKELDFRFDWDEHLNVHRLSWSLLGLRKPLKSEKLGKKSGKRISCQIFLAISVIEGNAMRTAFHNILAPLFPVSDITWHWKKTEKYNPCLN